MKRVLCVLACLCGVAMGAQVATISGVKVEIGQQLSLAAPIVFSDLKFYASKAIGTGEPGIVVSGYATSMLPDHFYSVRVKIDLWENFKGVSVPCSCIEFTLDSPEPKRKIRFTGFSTAKPATVTGMQVGYTLQRIEAKPAVQVQQ